VPTYQYACTACGEQSEVVQKFTDDPLTICGACGGRLRKVFSPVGIVFKGTGFYRTDSRAAAKETVGAKSKNNGSDSGAKPSADSGSSGDSKAAGNGSSGSASPPKNGGTSGGSSDTGKSSAKVA
jgi:putative FmdB family regulatory protein